MKLEDFKLYINALRKQGGWYQYVDRINGKVVRIKGYRTWLQIYTVNGVSCSNCMDVSVKQFNIDLMLPFEKKEVIDNG